MVKLLRYSSLDAVRPWKNSLIRIVFAPPCSLMIPLYKGIAQKSTIILVDFIQYNVVLFVQNLQYKIKKFQHITKMHVLCLITDEKIAGT